MSGHKPRKKTKRQVIGGPQQGEVTEKIELGAAGSEVKPEPAQFAEPVNPAEPAKTTEPAKPLDTAKPAWGHEDSPRHPQFRAHSSNAAFKSVYVHGRGKR